MPPDDGSFTPPPPASSPSSTAAQLGGAAVEVGASMIPGVGEAMDVYTLFAPDSTLADRGLSVVSLGANAFTGGLLPNFGGWLKAGRKVARAADKVGDIAKTTDKVKDVAKATTEGAEATGKTIGSKVSKRNSKVKRKKRKTQKKREPRKYEKKVVNEDGSTTYTLKTKDGSTVDVTYRNGDPDFSPYKYDGTRGKSEVNIKMTGDNNADFRAANQAAGFGNGPRSHPRGYTWHHSADGKTMQLVDSRAHSAAPHTGGASAARNGL